MGGISSPGIGSGLNTASIVSQLVAAERAGPENRLIRAETSASTKLSAYGSLKGQVADFASAYLHALDSPSASGLNLDGAASAAVPGHPVLEVVGLEHL